MKAITQQQAREIADLYNRAEYIFDDPVLIPSQYQDKRDVEISAVVTSWLYIGDRETVLSHALEVDSLFQGSPSGYVLGRQWAGLKGSDKTLFRVLKESDFADLCSALADVYSFYPSLEDCVLGFLQDDDLLTSVFRPFAGVNGFADPSNGSGCKRLSLLLRWLVRKDSVDLGVWSKIGASSLLVSVDNKVLQVARENGITTRKTPNRKAAEEISAYMEKIFPGDPAKGDFLIFGLGDDRGDLELYNDLKSNPELLPVMYPERIRTIGKTRIGAEMLAAANVPAEPDQQPEDIEEIPADDLKSFVESRRGDQRNEDGTSLVKPEKPKSRRQIRREIVKQGLERFAQERERAEEMNRKTHEEFNEAVNRNQALMVATTYNVLFANHIATNAIRAAVSELKEAGVLKMGSKKQAADLVRAVENFERRCYSVYGPKGNFLKDCVSRVMGEIALDVEKVFYSIKSYLDKLKIERSAILARFEQARCLCALAVDIHVQRIGFLREKEPSIPTLEYMCMDKILRFADQLSDMIVKGVGRVINLNEDRNCVLSVEVVDRKLADEERISRAILLNED